MDQKEKQNFDEKRRHHGKVEIENQLKEVKLTKRTKQSPFIKALKKENQLNKVKTY